MNSRRLIVAPGVKTTHRIVSQPSGSWNGMRGVQTATNCSRLGMSALRPTTRSKPERLRIRQMLSALPPKADLPPDLRTTPAASPWRTPPSRPRGIPASNPYLLGGATYVIRANLLLTYAQKPRTETEEKACSSERAKEAVS